VTLFCGLYILYEIYRGNIERQFFYFAWSAGYLLYGIEILTRSYNPLIVYVLGSLAYTLIALGVWSLAGRKGIYGVIISYGILGISFYYFPWFSDEIGLIAAHLIITVGFVYLRFAFSKTADKFIFGWVLLTFTNVLLLDMGWIRDIFATFAKLVLFSGILDYEFMTLSQRLEHLLSSKKDYPIDADMNTDGGNLFLVQPNPETTNSKEIEWVREKIVEGIENEIDTYLLLVEDPYPLDEIRKMIWLNPDRVHVLMFSSSAEETKKEFIVLPAGLHEIGASIHEILKRSISQKQGCVIIIVSVSELIHVFGASASYQMLLQKRGAFRESSSSIYGLFHPETHDASTTAMFRRLSDSAVDLS